MKGHSYRQIFPLIIIALVAVASLAILYCNTLLGLEGKEDSTRSFHVLIGPYINVLDPDRITRSTARIKQTIINNEVICDHGSVSMLKQDSVIYIYMCMLDRIEITPDVESYSEQGYEPARNVTAVGLVISETGNYTISLFSSDYVKVYSKVFSFKVDIPRGVRQGLIRVFEDNGDAYYLIILNIPYIYFKAQYREGIGNASLIIRIVFNINGENLTAPFIMEYYLNTDTEAFLSPLESPITRSSIEEKSMALAPLLHIDGGKRIELKYYVEVFVKGSGNYKLELTIGYPGVRIVELQ